VKITNRLGLPEAIVRSVTNDPYSKGNSDFSITELLQPPRIRALKKIHEHELEEDAADRIWSLLGQSIHTILERANNPINAISEKRYFAKFGDYTVSAQIDSLELTNGKLRDFKTTTAWKFKTDQPAPPDYVSQLNGQLEILRRNGLDARSLEITGILRDWNMRESKHNPGYPKFQVASLDIPIWSREETTKFIEDRIYRHLEAEKTLPRCSQDDMWASPDKFAVMKGTNKRAFKLADSLAEAQDYLANGAGDRIEVRRGEARRCQSYCPVSNHCTVYQQSIKEQSYGDKANI